MNAPMKGKCVLVARLCHLLFFPASMFSSLPINPLQILISLLDSVTLGAKISQIETTTNMCYHECDSVEVFP